MTANLHLTDVDGDFVKLQDSAEPTKGFGFIMTSKDGAWLDREAAVRLIEALSERVEVADRNEAAAKAAAEAAKLKRGDSVRGFLNGAYTVVSDEVEGRVDVVALASGRLYENREATRYTRV